MHDSKFSEQFNDLKNSLNDFKKQAEKIPITFGQSGYVDQTQTVATSHNPNRTTITEQIMSRRKSDANYIDLDGKNINATPKTNSIEPKHYRKGKVDLLESWYLTRPFNEFRAIMESIAERYMKRIKNNRIEDLDKAIYTLERLKEYELQEAKQ